MGLFAGVWCLGIIACCVWASCVSHRAETLAVQTSTPSYDAGPSPFMPYSDGSVRFGRILLGY